MSIIDHKAVSLIVPVLYNELKNEQAETASLCSMVLMSCVAGLHQYHVMY